MIRTVWMPEKSIEHDAVLEMYAEQERQEIRREQEKWDFEMKMIEWKCDFYKKMFDAASKKPSLWQRIREWWPL